MNLTVEQQITVCRARRRLRNQRWKRERGWRSERDEVCTVLISLQKGERRVEDEEEDLCVEESSDFCRVSEDKKVQGRTTTAARDRSDEPEWKRFGCTGMWVVGRPERRKESALGGEAEKKGREGRRIEARG